MTLATYFWFSQTSLYNQTAIGDLNWPAGLRGLMLVLAFLMISNVSYPAVLLLFCTCSMAWGKRSSSDCSIAGRREIRR